MIFSFALPVLVSAVGLFLLIKLGFFFIIHPIRTAREFVRGLSDREARRSFFLALAGTLGVGNIFGVSAGIMIGGAGSLFWLFISTFFAMIIKYAETLLVFDSKIGRGGMSGALKKIFVNFGGILAPIYAVLTLLLALFMGSAMQSVALIDVAEQSLSIPPLVSGLILASLLLPCVIGGTRRIENITEIVIPMTTMIYIIMCFCVILCNFSQLGDTVNNILSSAFNARSALGGGISFVAAREGFARGILSNEAGVGTSAMAHSRSQDRTPHRAGLFAMCEVVFDSSLLCMLTGFAILLAVPDFSIYKTPMALVGAAFYSTFGRFSNLLLPLVIFAFAYATLICWFYYGKECVSLYFSSVRWAYAPCFILFALFCRSLRSDFLLYIIDFILFFMALMTLSAIIKRSKRIAEISLRHQKNPE